MSAAVAVLFARKDSIYKTIPECDVWDAERDARKFTGGAAGLLALLAWAWGRRK